MALRRVLKIEAESCRDHGLELESGHVVVQLISFGLQVCLKTGKGTDRETDDGGRIAGASVQVECGAGSARVNDSNLKGEAEMAVVTGEQVSLAYGQHRAGLGEVDRAGAVNGVRGIAGVRRVVEGKGLASGNGSVGGKLVPVVDEHAGTEMEAAAEGKPVVMSFHGAEAKLARVSDSVLVETMIIVEHVESGPQVGAERERRGSFCAGPKRRYLNGDAEPRKRLDGFGLRGTEGWNHEDPEN